MSKSNDSCVPALGSRQLFKFGAIAADAGLMASRRATSWPTAAVAAVAVGGSGGGGALPPSPATTPFVVTLPVYLPKQPVLALDPAAQEAVLPASADGRPNHSALGRFLSRAAIAWSFLVSFVGVTSFSPTEKPIYMKRRQKRRFLAPTVIAMVTILLVGVLGSTPALAALNWSWEFSPQPTVGPQDRVDIKATIHNHITSTSNIYSFGPRVFRSNWAAPDSDQLYLFTVLLGLNYQSPGANALYTFGFLSPQTPPRQPFPVIAPGQSYTFTYHTLIPNAPPVPPGTYVGQGTGGVCDHDTVTMNDRLDCIRQSSISSKAANNQYSLTVAPAAQQQTRPEFQPLVIVPSTYAVPAPLKRNAVILVHGWNSNPDEWAKPMAAKIREIIDLRASEKEVWDVMHLDWSVFSASALTYPAYVNAGLLGNFLGKSLLPVGYDHIHFIAHSAGSNLIENAAVRIKLLSPPEHKPVIHSTFLDAYDPNGNSATYGFSATWAEHYVDKRRLLGVVPVPNTDLKLEGAYNIDVTELDNRLFVVNPVTWHAYPYRWYGETVDNSRISHFGFSTAMENGNNALLSHVHLPKGNECPMVNNFTICPSGTTSTIPAVRSTPVVNPFDIWTNPGLVTINQSLTGAVSVSTPQVIGLTNNSPVWVSLTANIPQGFNTLEFDYRFTAQAEGLLSAFIDNDVAFKADQRQASAGVNLSGRIATGNITPGPHTLSFRLDHFTPALSAVDISNIRTSNISIVREPNLTPVANAGVKQKVRLGTLVHLDGSASADPDRKPLPLTYDWKQISGPPVLLFDSATTRPKFTPVTRGHYVFSLVVNDGQSNSNVSRVKVHASALGDLDDEGDGAENNSNGTGCLICNPFGK